MAKLNLKYNILKLDDIEYDEANSSADTLIKVNKARELYLAGADPKKIAKELGLSTEKRAKELVTGVNQVSHNRGWKIISGLDNSDREASDQIVAFTTNPNILNVKADLRLIANVENAVFNGTLQEYLLFLQPYLISSQRLVAWQKELNYYFENNPEWIVIRNGATISGVNYKYCGKIFDISRPTVITTDNEATVSLYEYARKNDPNSPFKLISLLKNNCIVTGTIKGSDLTEAEKKDIIEDRLKYNFPIKNLFAPKRPFSEYKYSHIGRAKPDRLPTGPLDPLITIGLRCVSPMNIILTHTPSAGNYSLKHIHELDGKIHLDLAEKDAGFIFLKYSVSLLARHVKSVPQGTSCLIKFLIFADILEELKMDKAMLMNEKIFNKEMEEIWNESSRLRVKIIRC